MSILSPTGDPENNKHLWWRCVFIAAAVQPVLILLYLIFRSTVFGNILLIVYFPCIAFAVLGFPASLPILFVLLPVFIALYSFVLGSIFYFVCWLKEKDF